MNRYITGPFLARFRELRYGFSTRLGGVSTGPYQSFNLAHPNRSKDPHVGENWSLFRSDMTQAQEPVFFLEQQHGTDVVIAGEANRGDALITNQNGCCIGVFTADCLPVLVYDPIHHAIGAVHGGWRSLAKGILTTIEESMRRLYGSEFSKNFFMIGPSIKSCCYEVDDPVIRHFKKYPAIIRPSRPGHWWIDLEDFVMRELSGMGVPGGQIERHSLCTRCDVERFYSHRRDLQARGSHFNFIMLPAF